MYLCMTREAFVAALVNALCVCRLIQSRNYGFVFAEAICKSMGFDRYPDEMVVVDCRVLWRTIFKRLQRTEPTGLDMPYSDLARTMLGELISPSLRPPR